MELDRDLFLPVSREDMARRGWDFYDFLLITGDAYVDHPSFGPAIIGRVLEAEGYRVAVLSPRLAAAGALLRLGRPRLRADLRQARDSMVAHYTAAKKRRHDDTRLSRPEGEACAPTGPLSSTPTGCGRCSATSPSSSVGWRPACAASPTYWEDKVRRSILFDAQADLHLRHGGPPPGRSPPGWPPAPVGEITDIRGTCAAVPPPVHVPTPSWRSPPLRSVRLQGGLRPRLTWWNMTSTTLRGKAILQKHGRQFLLVNPPAYPLTTAELDAVAELPYVREPHPMYDSMGGVPAIEEVRFSITHNRGCFGACSFCSLAFHQGRTISARSHQSVLREAEALTRHPGFKGYIHDVGGPSATFRRPSCQKQLKHGMCRNRACLAPEPCPNLDADHTDYMMLLRKLRQLPKVKKVFIRSGIRFDFLMKDPSGEFFTDLIQHHISGQLKVAPEHCSAHTLDYMGKPHIQVYEKFREKYFKLNRRYGKDQYLVPYLISSHPGCTLEDAVQLAEWLNRQGHMPEQVQDFYPTPGTLSTCMWYTGLDPRTMQPVFVPRTPHDKALQRALMQWRKPQNRKLVLEALHRTGREDLIGYGKRCLIRPDAPASGAGSRQGRRGDAPAKQARGSSGRKEDRQGRQAPWKGRPAPAAGGRASHTGRRAKPAHQRGKRPPK